MASHYDYEDPEPDPRAGLCAVIVFGGGVILLTIAEFLAPFIKRWGL